MPSRSFVQLLIDSSQPSRYAATRLAVELKLFETLVADSGRAKTIAELSAPKSADPALVARIARHLAATGVIQGTGSGTYVSNALSKALAKPEYSTGIKIWYVLTLIYYTRLLTRL